jgi:Pyruvate/2-oxoacid:ferredoxin oxidoreductase gamma subunit
MQPPDLMQALLDLAEETGLEVRTARSRPGSDEPAVSSAVCRVKGRIWVVLSQGDPVDVQLAVLASAVGRHAGETLEDRYLPPAVRALLEANALDREPG